MEFMFKKEHGIVSVSLMARVVLGYLRRFFAVVRAAWPRGPAKAQLFFPDIILLGENCCTGRNHRVMGMMRLTQGDRRRAK